MMNRRTFMKSVAASALALQANLALASDTRSKPQKSGKKSYKRIAVEESWMPTEIFDDFRAISQTEEAKKNKSR